MIQNYKMRYHLLTVTPVMSVGGSVDHSDSDLEITIASPSFASFLLLVTIFVLLHCNALEKDEAVFSPLQPPLVANILLMKLVIGEEDAIY